MRVTRRLAWYIYQLCQFMTVSEVARHLDLDWKTVKNIDKYYLERFFDQLSAKQRDNIQAVAMDMWDPFIKAVYEKVPHVISSFNKVIDKVRNREYQKASDADKSVYKGTKYLLLKKP